MAGSDAEVFFEQLLAGVPDYMFALLWTRQDKRSHWMPLSDGVAPVAERATQLADSHDVYAAVSVADVPGAAFSRITSDNSSGIMGLWADIDIADPDVHKKWNLPPDEAAARDLLKRAGMEPTMLVHSGHGLQAWWLFKEFWQFDQESDRLAASDLAQRWNTTLRVRAAESEWTVDSTFDLARVMRVPGTRNLKSTPAMPVRLLEVNERLRYEAQDFDAFLISEDTFRGTGATPSRAYVVGELQLHESAWPPGEKLEALREADTYFDQSWTRKRRDLVDQSPSSYDLSLANLAVMAGWTDQEIANLLIASRRKHRDDMAKALRLDYMQRTIARARDSQARDIATEALDDVVDDLKAAVASGDDEEVRTRRRAAMGMISQQLEVEVQHFIKYTSDPPSYRMITPTCGVDLGGASGILTWAAFRERVAASTGRMIPRFKQTTWDRIAQAMFDACEEQDVGLESTEEGQVLVWLSEYFMQKPPASSADEAAMTEYPYADADGLHFFGASFRRWLWLTRSDRISQRELGRMLRQFGCLPTKINVTIEGARSSRAVWTMPPALQESVPGARVRG